MTFHAGEVVWLYGDSAMFVYPDIHRLVEGTPPADL